jgi:putative DNA primase/helicase
MTDRRFTVTFFDDVAAESLTTREVTLDELRDMALAITASSKAALPLFKMCKFGDVRTTNNSLRHNSNVLEIEGAETDYDSEVISFDEAVAIFKKAHLEALVYTSPSHTPDKPRWRAALPTSHPLPPEERSKLVARINGLFNGVLAGESFTLSQGFYIGGVDGNVYHRAEVVHGDFIDLRTDLDATARGKRKDNNNTNNTDAPPRQQARTDKQADPDLIYAAMAVIPNDKVDWIEWNTLGMAAFNATSGDERGLEAFDMWSRKLPGYEFHDKKDSAEARWNHYRTSPPTELGAGTIFQKANQAQPGWRALVGLPIDKINEVLRLARLPKVQYDPERKEVAKRFNILTTTLDEIVDQLRPRVIIEDDDEQGTRIEFEPVEPWPDAVDGGPLITDMVKAIRNHVILSEHQALAVTLWVIHTHVLEIAEHTPRLQIKSPTMRCGKSTLLSTIAPMVAKKLATENITMAALFRVIEMVAPTLLIDEADSFLKREDGRDREDMNGILNSGHKRDGSFIRTVGEDFEPRAFATFAPVAFAWLVKRGVQVAQTLEDRSITIELRRRLPEEPITRFRSTRTGHLRELGRRAARWVADHKIALGAADPELPEDLHDRAQDNWRSLISIADTMSAALGQKARQAAVQIAKENLGSDEDISLLLLADVAAIIKHKLQGRPPENVKVVSSHDVVAGLVAMGEEKPWAEWRRGRPITEHSLARFLRPFSLPPTRIRTGPGERDLTRGYVPADVLRAAERYVEEILEPEEDESVPAM